MQDGRQRLVDQYAEHGIQQALDQREGHVENDQALDQAVGRRQNGLVHAKNGFQRHVVELHIGRVSDEVVGRHTEHRHGCGTGNGTKDGRFAALVVLVDEARHRREHRAQHEVAQLTHTGGGGALDDDVEQVLHEADHYAVHGAQCKGTQQGRQVGKVHLDKAGNEHRDGKLNEHQDKGHRAEHGGNGQVVGRILSHRFCPPPGFAPFKKLIGKPFSHGTRNG